MDGRLRTRGRIFKNFLISLLEAWRLELGAWGLVLLSIRHIDARQFVAEPAARALVGGRC